jgi:hypothetical protein
MLARQKGDDWLLSSPVASGCLYERGHCQADFWARFSFSSILLFDLKSPFFRPDPGRPRNAARKICQGRRNSAAQWACP